MNLLAHFTSCVDTSIDDKFNRVCKVRFIVSDDFKADIETKLNLFFGKNCDPVLSDKDYYYRHDAPLSFNSLVLVPARNTLTVAVVTQVNLENTTFSATSFSTIRTMKKIIGVLALSPRLCKLAQDQLITARACADKICKLEGKLKTEELKADAALANLDAAVMAFEDQIKVTQSLKSRLDSLKKKMRTL